MNFDYKISNFRAIDNNGAHVHLQPITILTGCNNSGKSSIVKSLCLMKDFFRQIDDDIKNDKGIKLHAYKLDFQKRPHDLLGNFYQVIHEDGNSSGTNCKPFFSVELSTYSHFFMQDVMLQLTFCKLEEDELNNGYLQSIMVKDRNDNILFVSNRDGEMEYDFRSVKKELLFFLYTQHYLAKWKNEFIYNQAMANRIKPDNEAGMNLDRAFKKLVGAFNGRGFIELLEWQTLSCKSSSELSSTHSTKEVLLDSKLITGDFIESPVLALFSFFPFFKDMKDMDKDECILKIEKSIAECGDVNTLDKKLITTLLTNFKDSSFCSLSDMVCALENDSLFFSKKSKGLGLNGEIFPMPHTIWHITIGDAIIEEADIPEKLDYTQVLQALDKINQILTSSPLSYVEYDEVDDTHRYCLSHKIDYILRRSIEDILSQSLPGELSYTRTSLVNVKRMYGLEEDTDFSDMLKTFFENKRRLSTVQKNNDTYQPCSFLNKWINEFGVAQRVDIKLHADGYGVTIRLYSSETDSKGMLLADKGYGCTQLFSILLKIESAILESVRLNLIYHFDTRGIGEDLTKCMRSYSQLHPVTIALEEPENHLHPSLQSMLADMIQDAYSNYGVQFFVESHSEYLIRKMQLLVAKKKISSDSISLLYVNPISRPSYLSMLSDIGIGEDGILKHEFGSGFFDESIRLTKELFKSTDEINEK